MSASSRLRSPRSPCPGPGPRWRLGEWGLLAIGGAFGTLAHLLLIQAFRRAPTAIVSPMIYTQIIAACLIGYLVFGEVPTLATLFGAAIVDRQRHRADPLAGLSEA